MNFSTSMFRYFTVWLVHVLLCVASGQLNNPQVDLGYAIYEGTALDNGINQYLGMRYAAPPTGTNRFRAPMPPLNETEIVMADQFGPICYGVQGLAFEGSPLAQSEDCLFIDVYSPANVTNTSLPVMLWIQGGGFTSLINPNYNGTGLIEASSGNVIVVSFNYRVGPYGFLASEELAAEDNLNIGLRDQRAAMKWVSQHIAEFGGDPDQITLFGVSIGGGSVLLQTIAYGGNPPPEVAVNWSAGIGASVYIPPFREIQDVQFQYDQILNATNCTDLDCLRSLDSEQIQAANIGQPYPGQTTVPLFPYGLVVDGSMFTGQFSAMLGNGQFAKDKPIALGSGFTEGTIFAPQANTSADIISFLMAQFPDLESEDIFAVASLYNETGSDFPGVTAVEAPLYFNLARMYTDVSFLCPALDFATNLTESGVSVHYWRDSIIDPAELEAGYVVPHTWDMQAIWGSNYSTQYVALPNATSYKSGQSNSFVVPQVQAYWTSYAISGGDPNDLKDASAPVWTDFSTGERLKLQTNATAMEELTPLEYVRCAAWSRLSSKTHI